jgi:hypothetical protein
MKSLLFSYDRGIRICLRCHSWFLSEGAHTRICALCCAETEAAVTLPWLSQQSYGASRLAATVATKEGIGEAVT